MNRRCGMRGERVLRILLPLALLGGIPVGAHPQEALPAHEIVRRSQEAFLSAGEDMRARVVMKLVNKAGKERVRELTMLRKDLGEGNQKYFVYFHRPADVREMTFMVWKYPGRADDRWLFVPAIELVRRIAADDSRSSFVGSDFTYEDVSGRDLEADTHALVGQETLAGRACYAVESVPKEERGAEYRRKVSWIDRENFLPLKEEYYDRRGELYRIFTADQIEEVEGFPTVLRRTMKDVKKEHRTEVTFASVEYNVGLTEELFSERYLRQPPAEWIR
jgi:outer membrane lipoprotein-sorting protein